MLLVTSARFVFFFFFHEIKFKGQPGSETCKSDIKGKAVACGTCGMIREKLARLKSC